MGPPNSGLPKLEYYLFPMRTSQIGCETFAHVLRLIDWIVGNLRDLLRGKMAFAERLRDALEPVFFTDFGELLDRKL